MTLPIDKARAVVEAMTPGPWRAVDHPNAPGVACRSIGPDTRYIENGVVSYGDHRTNNATGIVFAASLARVLVDPRTGEMVKATVLLAMHSPASGSVSWTDEKLAAVEEQAGHLAAAILSTLAALALEQTNDHA